MGVMMQTFYWDCPREDGWISHQKAQPLLKFTLYRIIIGN